MDTAIEVLIHATTFSVWLFTIGYGTLAPWWRTSIGRNLFAMSMAHLSIFTLISSNLIWGLQWGDTARTWIRLFVYGSVFMVFAWWNVILFREQIRQRKGQGRPQPMIPFQKYGKALAQVAMALLVAAITVTTGDGYVSDEEKFQLAVAFAGAIGTYLVPAVPEWPWMKTAVAALLVGVQTAGSVALDGLSTNDVLVIAAAVLGLILTGVSPANTEQRHRSTNHSNL